MINKIEQLIVIITGNCNSGCIHCTYWKNKSQIFLDKEIFYKTILSLKKIGLKSVMISGGEPFLHPSIIKFVEFLHENNLGIKLTTNGIILNKINSRYLKKIDDFSISLDSSNRKTYHKIRGVNKFDKVLENIKMLRKIKKRVKLSFLIQKKNYNEIPVFLDLCNKIGVKKVSFLVPNKNGEFNECSSENYSKMLLLEEELFDFEKNILPKIKSKLKKYKISSNYKLNVLDQIVKYFKCFNKKFKCNPIRYTKCSFPINNLILTEKGKLKPCLFMPYEYKNPFIKNENIDKIKEFRNEYLFKNNLFEKHCIFCLEVPL